jgi:hypothetical protein
VELSDEEYKLAVVAGNLCAEVQLRGESSPHCRLWAGRAFSESSSLPEDETGLSETSESVCESKLRQQLEVEMLAMESSSNPTQLGAAFGAACAKVGSFVQNRLSILSWWLAKGRDEMSPLVTATNLLGSDFSQAVFTLCMQHPGGRKASPAKASESLYYRFYVAGDPILPWGPAFRATHHIYRTHFARRKLSVERPLTDTDWSSRKADWPRTRVDRFGRSSIASTDWRSASTRSDWHTT